MPSEGDKRLEPRGKSQEARDKREEPKAERHEATDKRQERFGKRQDTRGKRQETESESEKEQKLSLHSKLIILRCVHGAVAMLKLSRAPCSPGQDSRAQLKWPDETSNRNNNCVLTKTE